MTVAAWTKMTHCNSKYYKRKLITSSLRSFKCFFKCCNINNKIQDILLHSFYRRHLATQSSYSLHFIKQTIPNKCDRWQTSRMFSMEWYTRVIMCECWFTINWDPHTHTHTHATTHILTYNTHTVTTSFWVRHLPFFNSHKSVSIFLLKCKCRQMLKQNTYNIARHPATFEEITNQALKKKHSVKLRVNWEFFSPHLVQIFQHCFKWLPGPQNINFRGFSRTQVMQWAYILCNTLSNIPNNTKVAFC